MAPRAPIAVLAGVLSAALLAACGSDGADRGGSSGKTAVATTSQVGDLARAVAGDRAGVRQILRPNSDPHEYEPRPSDVRAIAQADVVLRSGGDLDEWLDGILENAASDAAVVALLRALDRAIAACLGAIPAAQRRLVTDHDALGYYADRYDVDIVGTVIP